jgi:Fic/DOC family
LRLIREIHKILWSKGRGSQKHPGEFRETQNWIGGTRPGNAAFVPPPEKMMECMGALEKFLHREREDLPILVKAALVHVQFETIHPLPGRKRTTGPLVDYAYRAGDTQQERRRPETFERRSGGEEDKRKHSAESR